MRLASLLAAVAASLTCACACAMTANQQPTTPEHHGRKKTAEDMMKDMYTSLMLAKNMIGFMLMFVSPIIQIKGFGLSVVNTLINLTRLFIQMHSAKLEHPHHAVSHSYGYSHGHGHGHGYSHGTSGVNLLSLSGAEDRLSAATPADHHFAYYTPPPVRNPQHAYRPTHTAQYAKNGSALNRNKYISRFR